MIGTILISAAALLVAVLGCAWLKPVAPREEHRCAGRPDRPRRETELGTDDALSQR
jgi:hypothetical protein